ncbi:HK97-gp10 family putative phage morphogenesis protein [Clostridioides sp. ZZV14-6044]|uniref:HK97-gp10 family putative phage morphogenesis protein n=1 Tax=unclassified Clostridioides TaxID=2635829 RepID=UPI001D11123A|nr:HK97 gp10 family phage protein [Clostridioides sp. ZZV14-6104]MCC0744575.1 HK97 gp10 family phage protein [Clostridioides sp. ZZV14-6044]
MGVEITTEGFDAILSKIESMGKSGDRLLNEAVKAGGNVILQDALPRVKKRTGKLEAGLKVSGVKKKGNVKYVLVGITKEDNSEIFYGKFLELGASAHQIPIKKGKKKGRIINHPGVSPKPFLAPAFESKKDEAKNVMKEILKQGLGL